MKPFVAISGVSVGFEKLGYHPAVNKTVAATRFGRPIVDLTELAMRHAASALRPEPAMLPRRTPPPAGGFLASLVKARCTSPRLSGSAPGAPRETARAL